MKSLKISFLPKHKLILPLAHFDILQGLFYKLLSQDKELADAVHEGKLHPESRYKYCCFTDIDGVRKVEGRQLIYSGVLEWQIRSMDDIIIDAISMRLKDRCMFSLADTECDVIRLEVSQQEVLCGHVICTMDTPVALYTTDSNGHNLFRGPADEDFSALMERNLENKFREYYDQPAAPGIKIRPVRAEACRKCVTRFKGIYITAYYGSYEIKAAPDVLNLAYYAGIGSKNTQGFGTIRSMEGESI